MKEEVNLNIKFLEEYNHYEKVPPKDDFKELPRPFYIHVKNSKGYRKMSFDFICVAENINKLKILENELKGYKWFTKEEIQNSTELWKPLKVLALKAFDVYNEWLLNQNRK